MLVCPLGGGSGRLGRFRGAVQPANRSPRPSRQPDSRSPSPDYGGMPKAIGREHTNPLSRMKAPIGIISKERLCCIATEAVHRTRSPPVFC
jgi:hypothetical protein